MEGLIDKLNVFDFIEFDEGNHRYSYKGNLFRPVTSLKKKYIPEFNKDFISEIVAVKQGKTQREVLDEWEFKGMWGRTRGTAIHKFIENDLNGIDEDVILDQFVMSLEPEKLEQYLQELEKMKEYYFRFKEDNPKLIPIVSEKIVADKDHLVAGTIDQIFYNEETGKIEIWDWKSDGSFYKDYGKKLKAPFNDTKALKINEYSIQLSIYKYIIEKYADLEIDKLKICLLAPENDTYKEHDTLVWQDRIKLILDEHSRSNSSFT